MMAGLRDLTPRREPAETFRVSERPILVVWEELLTDSLRSFFLCFPAILALTLCALLPCEVLSFLMWKPGPHVVEPRRLVFLAYGVLLQAAPPVASGLLAPGIATYLATGAPGRWAAFREGLRKPGAAIAAGMVVGLLTMITVWALSLPFVFLITRIFRGSGPENLYLKMAVLPLLLVIVVAFFAAVWVHIWIRFCLAPPAAGREGLGPLAALKRSDALTFGKRKRLFPLYLIAGGIGILASSVSIPFLGLSPLSLGQRQLLFTVIGSLPAGFIATVCAVTYHRLAEMEAAQESEKAVTAFE